MKSILDVAYRLVLVLAYRITLFWRFMTRRPSFGAATAVKHDGRLLLVKDSYRGIWSMPGGRIRRGEEPAAAAVRELAEETGIELRQEAIALVGVFRNAWEYGIDTVHVFEATLSSKPVLRLDNREIIDARWVTDDEAQWLSSVPHVEDYLRRQRDA